MVRRITANLPMQLLDDASKVTGKGITETLIEGLTLLRQRRAFQSALALKGTMQLDVDTDADRERTGDTAGRHQ